MQWEGNELARECGKVDADAADKNERGNGAARAGEKEADAARGEGGPKRTIRWRYEEKKRSEAGTRMQWFDKIRIEIGKCALKLAENAKNSRWNERFVICLKKAAEKLEKRKEKFFEIMVVGKAANKWWKGIKQTKKNFARLNQDLYVAKKLIQNIHQKRNLWDFFKEIKWNIIKKNFPWIDFVEIALIAVDALAKKAKANRNKNFNEEEIVILVRITQTGCSTLKNVADDGEHVVHVLHGRRGIFHRGSVLVEEAELADKRAKRLVQPEPRGRGARALERAQSMLCAEGEAVPNALRNAPTVEELVAVVKRLEKETEKQKLRITDQWWNSAIKKAEIK